MTLNSVEYFIFLPLVFFIYHKVNKKYKWAVALVASYAFFASFGAPQAFTVLILVTLVSYFFGILIKERSTAQSRALFFWLGTGICVFSLAVVKYIPVFIPSVTSASPFAFLLNSIGTSYFIFSAISYIADIYLEIQEPEHHLGVFALSLAFFPKISQGPIERAGCILPQIRAARPFDYESVRSGIFLFLFGLAKKMIIADRFAPYVDSVYNSPQAYTGLPILVSTYAYAFQIYFDFSGYTDMARGSARMFGIELTQNFNSPYTAISVPDFWRRWHISFSRWIFDYLFKPMQLYFREMGRVCTPLALMCTFLISGAWHGVKTGFIIWGALHGFYLAVSSFYAPWRNRWQKRLGIENAKLLLIWRRFITFNLVSFAWIFFRAESFEDGRYLATHILDIKGTIDSLQRMGLTKYIKQYILLGMGKETAVILAAAVMVYLIIRKIDHSSFWRLPKWFRWCTYYAILLSIIVFAVSKAQFIYFRF